MKPAVTPYDRNSRLGLKMVTVNPCNEFIIETLLRWKVNVQKQGLNQFYTYNLAVQSVRKYPMPILCYEQMKAMEGFGKFFCTSVAKLVRAHYQRGRLPTRDEKDELDKQHELFLRREMKKFKTMNQKNGIKTEEDEEENDIVSDIEGEKYSQFNDNFQSQAPDGEDEEQGSIYDDESDISDSASFRSNKSYRPKPGTETFNILRAMNTCLENTKEKQKTSVSRGEINMLFYEWKMDKVRNWNKVLQNLKQSGYIKMDAKDDYWLLFTTKGKDYIQDILADNNEKDNKKFNHVWVLRKELVQHCQNLLDKLSILINMKISFKPDENIINALVESDKYKTRQIQFQLGSFLWILDSKILDYIAFRFKVENLDVEQFLSNCERAKDSQCSSIYFIMQYPSDPSKKQALPTATLQLIQKARASGFKIVKTHNNNESICFLSQITEKIKEKLRRVSRGEELWLQGNLEFYNQKNRRYLPIVLKEITKKILKCIPKMKRKTVQTILQKLPSLKALYNQLFQLTVHQERITMINWWLQSCNSKPAVNIMLVDILFSESYELPEDQII